MKIVVIGSGKIVRKIIKSLPEDILIHGIYSRNKKTSFEIAKLVNAKVYNELNDIQQDKSNFDFVYIATPHTSHFKYAKFCLENDINVLVEKPIVTSSKEIEELIKLSKLHNSYIAEAMWSFISNPLNEVKDYLKGKEIKEVSLSFSIFKPFFDKKDRLFKPELKGGALFDIGIYLVTMSYMFFGVPLSISIESKIKNNIDVVDKIKFHYKDFEVNIYTSFNSFKDKFIIKGKDFTLISSRRSHAPNKIKVKDKNGTWFIKGETSYNEEYRFVYKEILEGKKECSRISLKDNLEIIRILENLDKKMR